jgi:kinesin family protein 4/21/27
LEKDLYFYKKTSRDLKKKLKELAREAVQWQQALSESKTFRVVMLTLFT